MASFEIDGGVVTSGVVDFVTSESVLSDALVESGGLLVVLSGGEVVATDDAGGGDIVYGGGSATSTFVTSGGTETVASGATASRAVIDGGAQFVSGTAISASVENGGLQIAEGDASLLSGTLIASGGQEVLSSFFALDRPTIERGGYLDDPNLAFVSYGLATLAGPFLTINQGGVFDQAPLSGDYDDDVFAMLPGLDGGSEVVREAPYASSGAVVASGGADIVVSGRTASSASVQSGGVLVVLSSGSALGATIFGGAEIVSGGGSATSTFVTAGGTETVLSGGTASASVIDGGTEIVSGTVIGATVENGGVQIAEGASSLLGGTVIASGGYEVLSNVLAADNPILERGGSLDDPELAFVSYGQATLSGQALTIEQGSLIDQLPLGGAYGDDVFAMLPGRYGGTEIVREAPFASSGALVSSGNADIVAAGGTATSATVQSGGVLLVSPYGRAIGAAVLGGDEIVSSDGSASSTSVLSGGTETVLSGGTASASVIDGGTEIVHGTAISARVESGGVQIAEGASSDLDGTVIASGGYVMLSNLFAADHPTIERGGYLDDPNLAFVSYGLASRNGPFIAISQGGLYDQLPLNGSYGDDVFAMLPGLDGGTEIVREAAFALSGAVVGSGQADIVVSGPTPTSTTVESGGLLVVSSGGAATDAFVSGREIVSGGGSTTSTTILSGGTETVDASGVASGSVIDGGEQIVSGIAISAMVENGGVQIAEGAVSRLSGTVIASGGYVVLSNVAALDLPTIQRGGHLDDPNLAFVSFGLATLSGQVLTINQGGVVDQLPLGGGYDDDVFAITPGAYGGAEITREAPFSTSGAVVGGGQADIVVSGQTATSVTADSGGLLVVLSGGSAFGATLLGDEVISGGGSATSTAVISGGAETVLSGGEAISAFVANGGRQIVSGTALSATIADDGVEIGAGASSKLIGTVVEGGGLEVLSSFFSVDRPTIQPGGSLDDPNLSFVSYGLTTVDDQSLTINQGGLSDQLPLSAAYGDDAFAMLPGVDGGTEIERGVCYRRGTRIRTTHGDVAIEKLSAGDRVVTASGETRPVTWLGRRRYRCALQAEPRDAWPVRVAAHAFGENQPDADLYLSPGHSVRIACVEPALVPISELVNGATIARAPMDEVEYWHVELDAHDVILANNLPAESYLDDDNRSFFTTRGLKGGQPAAPVHPVVEQGPLIEAARAQLQARAERLGWVASSDPGLWLFVDGSVERPRMEGDVAEFPLPGAAREVRIVSDTFIPAEIAPGGNRDWRKLGVCLLGLELVGGERNVEIALDDPRFVNPYPLERDGRRAWRWTDGDLALPPSLWAPLEGDVRLRLRIDIGAVRVWRPPAAPPGTAGLRPAVGPKARGAARQPAPTPRTPPQGEGAARCRSNPAEP